MCVCVCVCAQRHVYQVYLPHALHVLQPHIVHFPLSHFSIFCFRLCFCHFSSSSSAFICVPCQFTRVCVCARCVFLGAFERHSNRAFAVPINTHTPCGTVIYLRAVQAFPTHTHTHATFEHMLDISHIYPNGGALKDRC